MCFSSRTIQALWTNGQNHPLRQLSASAGRPVWQMSLTPRTLAVPPCCARQQVSLLGQWHEPGRMCRLNPLRQSEHRGNRDRTMRLNIGVSADYLIHLLGEFRMICGTFGEMKSWQVKRAEMVGGWGPCA